jgi:TolB-like protein
MSRKRARPGGILCPAGFFLRFLFFCLACGPLRAGGKTEEADKIPINKEWIVCVTSFDVSSLPPSRQLIGDVVTKNLVEHIKLVNYRKRMLPEYTYYEGTAWSTHIMTAGKKIAEKRNERDQLLYRGYPGWQYRRDLKRIEAELEILEEEYEKVLVDIPLVDSKPLVALTEGNYNGVFPIPPQAGQEYQFCQSQKADAFLAGTVKEYHGRIYVSLRVYTLYSRSYFFEDRTIFSLEDTNLVIDELAARLTAAVAGSPPAAILVKTEPEDASVLIDGSFAGRGGIEVAERSPGPVTVTVFAENYESQRTDLELKGGELAEIYINLSPLALAVFSVTVPDNPDSQVYQGTLFAGTSPLSLTLPAGSYENIVVETVEGKTASVVIGPDFTRDTLSLKVTPPKEEGRVNRFRRGFYGAYGRFWLALPVAVLVSGLSTSYTQAYNRRGIRDMYDKALGFYYASVGTMAVAGGFLGEALIRAFFYVYTATKNEPRLAK